MESQILRVCIRNRNGTTRLSYGVPTEDGGLISDGSYYGEGSWFKSRPSKNDEDELDNVEETKAEE